MISDDSNTKICDASSMSCLDEWMIRGGSTVPASRCWYNCNEEKNRYLMRDRERSKAIVDVENTQNKRRM